jgi:hypothetical protein
MGRFQPGAPAVCNATLTNGETIFVALSDSAQCLPLRLRFRPLCLPVRLKFWVRSMWVLSRLIRWRRIKNLLSRLRCRLRLRRRYRRLLSHLRHWCRIVNLDSRILSCHNHQIPLDPLACVQSNIDGHEPMPLFFRSSRRGNISMYSMSAALISGPKNPIL